MSNIGELLEQIMRPEAGGLSVHLAKYILTLRFTESQLERYDYLSQRIGEGGTPPEELAELDAFVTANTVLALLKLKAKCTLQHNAPEGH